MKNCVFMILTCLMATLGLEASIAPKPGIARVNIAAPTLRADAPSALTYPRSILAKPRIIEHQVPTFITGQNDTVNGGVTVAHDGSVWFSVSFGIARLAYGTFYLFPQDNPDTSLYAASLTGVPIVEGADYSIYASANLPFNSSTCCSNEAVSRTTARSKMKSFIFAGSADLTGLTVGPDKRLYASVPTHDVVCCALTGYLYAFQNLGYHPSYNSVALNDNDVNGHPVEPTAVTTGEDGSIWVTATTGPYNLLYRISTQLKITAKFRLPDNSQPAGLVWGPDDALWTTESGTNHIGRTDGRGRTTEFKIPTANSLPNSITVGADGALWFSESNANKIARITTAGVVTEFTIPTANSNPVGVAAPLESLNDRVIWFAEANANKIGELRF